MSKRLKDQGQLRSDVTKMVKIETPSLSPSWIPITWQLFMNKKCFGEPMYLTSASQWNEKTPRKITEIRKEEQPHVSCILLLPGWHSSVPKGSSPATRDSLAKKVRMR